MKSAIASIVGREYVLSEPSALHEYGKDWTKGFTASPSLVVRPGTVAEVQDLVRLCNHEGLALVPSGGRTGLSAGAYAQSKEIVLSLERLNSVSIDSENRRASCGAGVRLETLQNKAAEANLYYPVDLASRGSCTIGGTIATNAGGLFTVRYGHTRSQVCGAAVVTGAGELLKLPALRKNPSGFDLLPLFIGSEGCLGIVVEAELALCSRPRNPVRILTACPSFEACTALLAKLRAHPLILCEYFSRNALEYVLKHHPLKEPFSEPHPHYLLFEVERIATDADQELLAALEQRIADGLILDAVMSQNAKQYRELLEYRELIGDTTATHYFTFKNDVAASPDKIEELHRLLQRLGEETESFGDTILFGHIAEGSLHINLIKHQAVDDQKFITAYQNLAADIATQLATIGGTIAAEHGIGLLKKPFLELCRDETTLTYMRQLRLLFDPNRVLNPGKVV